MQDIQWGEFSPKHKKYIRNAYKSKMSVAEGSIRSGKTVDHCAVACMELETCPDKIHLATGSSLPNAKLNIGDCNGYGLEHLFKGRCHWGKYKSNEALFINTKTGEKIVIFAGGGKADSYKKILGNSYGLWIATEINEHYDNDDSKTSFIKVAMGRQVASKRPKILWDLNPCNPNAKIYKDYIDLYREKGLLGGYNYEHFTLEDNANISEERREEIKSQYNEGSIWYKRDILGERCVADGNIYDDFANHTEDYLISRDDLKNYRFTHMYCGVDFGGNKSADTFVCVGFTYMFNEVIVLRSERHEGKTTPQKLEQEFALFLERCYNDYGMGGEVYCDSAEQTLIGGLRTSISKNNLPFAVRNAKKNEVLERIRMVLRLMGSHRFKVVKEDCQSVIKALSEAVWNNKEGHEDERLDNFTSDIDTLDALEYAIEPHINDLKYLK